MTDNSQSLFIADLSAFTKSLRKALADSDPLPGHAKMLGLVAKAAGYRNHQHLRSSQSEKAQEPTPRLTRALRVFDEAGRMTRWPGQTQLQGLCLWVFWARLPAQQDLSERAVNEVLKEGASFGDHVLLRRSLIDHRLVERSTDGRVYRRIEQRPPEEALALIRALA